jgi:hypothetical protein
VINLKTMKTRILLLPVFIAALLFGVCQTSLAQSRETTLPKSMKGYELYSWKIRGEWYFSLLVGTNRLKTRQEITSTKVRLKGVKALKKKLSQIPKGAQIFMPGASMRNMDLPPQEIMKVISSYCKERGIELLAAPPVSHIYMDRTGNLFYSVRPVHRGLN